MRKYFILCFRELCPQFSVNQNSDSIFHGICEWFLEKFMIPQAQHVLSRKTIFCSPPQFIASEHRKQYQLFPSHLLSWENMFTPVMWTDLYNSSLVWPKLRFHLLFVNRCHSGATVFFVSSLHWNVGIVNWYIRTIRRVLW